jgi:hypothetical protein
VSPLRCLIKTISLIRRAHTVGTLIFVVVLFWWNWCLKSQLCACKAGALLLEPQLQLILLWLFWRWGLVNYFPKLASNCESPYFSLPSSYDYRCELLALGFNLMLMHIVGVRKNSPIFSRSLHSDALIT